MVVKPEDSKSSRCPSRWSLRAAVAMLFVPFVLLLHRVGIEASVPDRLFGQMVQRLLDQRLSSGRVGSHGHRAPLLGFATLLRSMVGRVAWGGGLPELRFIAPLRHVRLWRGIASADDRFVQQHSNHFNSFVQALELWLDRALRTDPRPGDAGTQSVCCAARQRQRLSKVRD